MSEEPEDRSDYNDSHTALLQVFISKQSLTYEEGGPILSKILAVKDQDDTRNVSREDFSAYVHAINDRISAYELEIRSTRHQRTNVEVYSLVNNTSDALMQMATTHSADEIAFVRRVLDAMFEAHNTLRAEVMAITSMQALKLAKPSAEDAERRDSGIGGTGPLAALTGSQAEAMLKDMATEGWFERRSVSGTHYYTLSPRALLELREWLVDTYNVDPDEDADEEEIATLTKIKTCAACKAIVTQGQRCSRSTCLGRLHDHCSERMFRAQGSRKVCPVCDTSWEGFLPVGVKAASGSQRANGTSARASAAGAEDERDDEA